MKRSLLYVTLIACAMDVCALDKGADGYYLVGDNAQWKEFCALANGDEQNANCRLTADITVDGSMAQTMLGNDANKGYAGILDGNGHSLTYNKTGIEKNSNVAPIRCANGAAIKNLHIAGVLEISTNNNCMGGIVALAKGATSIEGCTSSINLKCGSTGDAAMGGIVGIVDNGSDVTVKNCMVTGTLEATQGVSGLVGWIRSANTTSIDNVLFAGNITTSNAKNNKNIYRAGASLESFTNAFYVKAIDDATDGTLATEADLNSGATAYALQGEQDAQWWGQSGLNTINAQSMPVISSEPSDKVVKVVLNYNNSKDLRDMYANPDGYLPCPATYYCTAYSSEKPNGPRIDKAPENDGLTVYRNFNEHLLVVSANKAEVVILPFETEGLPSGVKAYNLTYADGQIKAEEITRISANKPVLFAAEQGEYVIVRKGSQGFGYDWSKINDTTNGALTGCYAETTPSTGDYVLSPDISSYSTTTSVQFNKVTDDADVKILPFGAYLVADGSSEDVLSVSVDSGITTGILDVETDDSDTAPVYYNLQGIKVDNPSNGIYICNGKKVIIQ